MKEKDYMNIMYGIREEYIEEAITWDGAERRRSRMIHRMTMSVGAIAAAIAVTVGVIAYTARNTNEMLPGNQDSTVEKLNILGGHGELNPYLSTAGAAYFRDDDCWYCGSYLTISDYLLSDTSQYRYDKWSVNGGMITNICDDPACTHDRNADCPVSKYFSNTNNGRLMTDGEKLYVARENKLYITDSYGNEVLFFEFGDDPMNKEFRPDRAFIDGIKALGNDCFLITTRDDEMAIPAYRLFNSKENSIRLFEHGNDIQPDGKGEGFYFRENDVYYCSFDHPDEPQFAFTVSDGELLENGGITWHVVNGALIYESPHSDLIRTDRAEQGLVADFIGKDPETAFAYTCMGDRMYCFCIDRAANKFAVYCTDEAYQLTDNSLIYEKDTNELWGYTPQESDLVMFYECTVEAGDTFMFMPPTEGQRGEEFVMLNTQTGDVKYAGHTIKDNGAETAPAETAVNPDAFTTAQNQETVTSTTVSGTNQAAAQTSVTSCTGVSETAPESTQQTEAGAAQNVPVFYGTVSPIGETSTLCDDRYVYTIYNGMRYARSGEGSAEHICQRAGCTHSDDSCPEFRLKGGNNIISSDGINLYRWTGRQVAKLNMETQEYVPLYSFGADMPNLDVYSLKVCFNPASGAYDKYFIYCADDSGRQTAMLFTAGGGIQNVASGAPTEDGADWMVAQYDQHNRQYIWTCYSDGSTVVKLDTATGAVTEYPLPADKRICSLGYANSPDWFVVNGNLWYNALDTGWYTYDPVSGTGHTVPTNGIPIHGANVFMCEDKLFVIDTQSQMLYACNYDCTNIVSASYSGLVRNLEQYYGSANMEICRVSGSYTGYVETPSGDNEAIFFTLTTDNRLALTAHPF